MPAFSARLFSTTSPYSAVAGPCQSASARDIAMAGIHCGSTNLTPAAGSRRGHRAEVGPVLETPPGSRLQLSASASVTGDIRRRDGTTPGSPPLINGSTRSHCINPGTTRACSLHSWGPQQVHRSVSRVPASVRCTPIPRCLSDISFIASTAPSGSDCIRSMERPPHRGRRRNTVLRESRSWSPASHPPRI